MQRVVYEEFKRNQELGARGASASQSNVNVIATPQRKEIQKMQKNLLETLKKSQTPTSSHQVPQEGIVGRNITIDKSQASRTATIQNAADEIHEY